jgi:hypothetical protein
VVESLFPRVRLGIFLRAQLLEQRFPVVLAALGMDMGNECKKEE